MQFDERLTQSLKDFVYADEEKRDYLKGAEILLRVSGNKIEYKNNIAKIENKKNHILQRLKKYLEFRLAGLTKEQVAKMKEEASVIIENIDTTEKNYIAGIREDHSELPDEIQAAYKEINVLLNKEKEIHLKIRSLALNEAACPESELYPFVKEILDIEKKRLGLWKKYDEYKAKKENSK